MREGTGGEGIEGRGGERREGRGDRGGEGSGGDGMEGKWTPPNFYLDRRLCYWYLRVFSSDGFPYVIAPAFSTPAFSAPPTSDIRHCLISHRWISSGLCLCNISDYQSITIRYHMTYQILWVSWIE